MDSNRTLPTALRPARGPRGLPFVGSLPWLWSDVLGFLNGLPERYGDIAKFNLFGTPTYLVSHPNDIADIFKREPEGDFTRTLFHDAFEPYFGDGLFNSDGPHWEMQRQQLLPYFSKSAADNWFPIIVEAAQTQLKRLDDDAPIKCDLVKVVLPLVQEIISRILFGSTLDVAEAARAVAAIRIVSSKTAEKAYASFVLGGILNKLPTPSNHRYARALAEIDTAIENLRKAALARPGGEGLIFKFARSMSSKELRDQLFTLFFAGQDTSINAIVWTLYYLCSNPDVEQNLRDELEQAVKSSNSIDRTSIQRLPYLRQVIAESMRLAPPAYAIQRDTPRALTLNGTAIDGGACVTLSQYVTHRRPDLWTETNQFRPQRFDASQSTSRTCAYFPFGGGMRICLGQHLAMLEISTAVALFVAAFRMELLPRPQVVTTTSMTLNPKNGIHVKLTSTGFLSRD